MNDPEQFVREDVRGFLAMLQAMDRPHMDEMPLDEARAAYALMGQVAEVDPHPLAVVRDFVCPGPDGEIPLRLYDTREHREPGPAVMFFHGGGFVIGDLETHNAFCTELAHHLDLPVIAVHYRLAPEAPFPAAPEDCEAASRWVAESPRELGRQVTGLVTMGDSAGGNLAIVIAQALSDNPAAVPVLVQAPIYPIASPVADTGSYKSFGDGYFLTARSMEFFDASYRPDEEDKRRYPILHEDHARTPPTILITASLDPLRDSGREYAAHLVSCGVDVVYLEARGSIHGFINMRKALPSAQADVMGFIQAIRLMLERHS